MTERESFLFFWGGSLERFDVLVREFQAPPTEPVLTCRPKSSSGLLWALYERVGGCKRCCALSYVSWCSKKLAAVALVLGQC